MDLYAFVCRRTYIFYRFKTVGKLAKTMYKSMWKDNLLQTFHWQYLATAML